MPPDEVLASSLAACRAAGPGPARRRSTRHLARTAGTSIPRPLPPPGPTRLPAQPRPAPPDQRPQQHVHRTRLRPAGRPMRPGPHPPWHHDGPTCPCNLAPPCNR